MNRSAAGSWHSASGGSSAPAAYRCWACLLYTSDMIVNLCKNRGYVFPGSEIYGGLANSWDSVSYTHLDVYKRQAFTLAPIIR